MSITSAAGVISLLEEEEPELKAFALTKLNNLVDLFWAEISDSVSKIETLHEDGGFSHSKLAALVASKVYYHLGEFDDSLFFALHADELFDVNDSSEYVETIIAKCIDKYTALRVAQMDATGCELSRRDVELMPRLEGVVNRMFERCFEDRQYRQALGIAVETRRLDMFERAVQTSDNRADILQFAYRIALTLINSRKFRTEVLQVLVRLYLNQGTPDYVSVCQCLIFLDDPQHTAEILEKLLLQGDDAVLVAYQIAFDLYENASQQFLHRVISCLKSCQSFSRMDTSVSLAPSDVTTSSVSTDITMSEAPSENASVSPLAAAATEATPIDTKTEPATAAPTENATEENKAVQERYTLLSSVLSGERVIALHLQFLIRNNKTDLKYLDKIRESIRNSITHNATVITNALMHAGTTSDQFLRDNLDWLAKATNWAKFTAVAGLGVIHHGHESDSLKLMDAYLPKDTVASSAYSEGGGLYALGMIHANHGGTGNRMTDYLLQQLKEATAEPVRHGGSLGLGLAAMGTARQDVYDQLKMNLYQDDAVTGEAAGIGMGLVMLGTSSARAIEDMVSYAKETQHEKILRGLAMGIALTMFGRMEEADPLISSLTEDKDPILRWSGMYTIATAYCGSGENSAVRKLLHFAISDTSDDVRRSAVTALGFVLFKTPEQVPGLVSLLAESFNPHVRYGAAMALGVACAGTALPSAVSVLEPLTQDVVHFVRQGALIALGMVLIQQNGVTSPRAAEFRQQCLKVVADKHDDVMAKFGAILGLGIVDAGGRNVTISLQTRTGMTNMAGAVGALLFQQLWYWFPMALFVSLAFVPSALIGLNRNLDMPQIEFRSGAKPSTFAYPPALATHTEKKKEKVETAVLSITAKQKRKEAEKKKATETAEGKDKETTPTAKTEKEKKTAESKEKEEKSEKSSTAAAVNKEEKDDKDKEKEKEKDKDKEKEKEKEKEKKEEEANFMMLSNPARVMRAQLRVISLPDDCRYESLKPVNQGGVVLLRDRRPQEGEETLVEQVRAHGPTSADDDDDLPEPDPPQPFEWTDEMEKAL